MTWNHCKYKKNKIMYIDTLDIQITQTEGKEKRKDKKVISPRKNYQWLFLACFERSFKAIEC